jgi:hypothetical protein
MVLSLIARELWDARQRCERAQVIIGDERSRGPLLYDRRTLRIIQCI